MAPQRVDYLHFLLVPLMSQSHLIPFVDVAKQLAARGHTVTLHLTPLNALRFRSVTDETLANPNLKIQFLVLEFPGQEAGLPEGCENMDSLPSPDFISNFLDATNLLQGPLEDWLEGARPRPNCLVSDICLPWTADLGLRFNIPRILFHGISCFTLLCSRNIDKFMAGGKVLPDSEPFRVPDMPDEIFFTKAQLPETRFRDGGRNADMEDLLNKFKAAELSADGVIVNSFEELEPNYVKGYQAVVKRLWCIGPVSLCNTKKSSKTNRGNKSAIDENFCLKWLDSRNASSVLYICFGSLCHVLASQADTARSRARVIGLLLHVGDQERGRLLRGARKLVEGGAARGASERRGHHHQGVGSAGPDPVPPGGRRVHDSLRVERSTLEGVAAGVPMITWPMFAEQFYNEKLIVQVAGIGVKVGVERCVNWGEEEEVGVLVRSEDVRVAIERLMDGGEEAEKRRRRARNLGEAAKRTVKEGGSSYRNMNLMIRHVKELLNCSHG